MNDTTDMKAHVDQLEDQVRDARATKREQEKELRRLDTKLHYSPNDEESQMKRDALVDTLTETDEQLGELSGQLQQAQQRLHRAQVAAERERLREQADGYHFDVPDDDPVLACEMLAAIADRLQYRFCSSQGYFEYLTGQLYGNPGGTDKAMQIGTDDDPNPEIGRDLIDKHSRLVAERDYIQTLRFAVEEEFKAKAENIPEDSTYKPQLLRRSDQEVFNAIEERRDRRFAEQREANQRTREAAKDFTRSVDMEVYRPTVN